MHGLNSSLKEVLGGRTATALSKSFDINTVDDLLRHFPRRYAERGELTEMSSLQVDEHVTIMADVIAVTKRPMRQKKGNILEVVVSDGKQSMKLTFFNQDFRERELKVGRRGLFSGKVSVFNNTRQLQQPVYVLIPADSEPDPEAVAAFARPLIPVYPATSTVTSWVIERAIQIVLDGLDPLIKDVIPEELVAKHEFTDLITAFHHIHQPATRDDIKDATKRFAFEEALTYQVILAQRRADLAAESATPRVRRADGALAHFDKALPFTLTAGQVAVCDEIFTDIAQAHPMHRLVQGEVGSGKTVCALRAMLAVVDAGGQAALLAPTEVLAQQHYRSIRSMLGDIYSEESIFDKENAYSTKVALLTGSLKVGAKRSANLDIVSGAAGIVIGTHALLQQHVDFHELALVVVDEQHRFGVEQRAALAAKAPNDTRPHVLVMTATPIPRTVAMTVFGDLDISTLAELPAGRSPITTHLVPAAEKPQFLERTWQRVREEVAKGHQVYIVCPRIASQVQEDVDDFVESGESTGTLANVEDTFTQLSQGPLFGLRIAQLHGRMTPDAKDEVMQGFAAAKIDVIVATTVIEVGVDVANASVMVIMDADRFGVSQLHQLRGRVGRGAVPGLCLLVTHTLENSPSRRRLDAVCATTDGFELSRVDLEQRREGDVLGASQSGRRSSLRILNVLRDEELIEAARLDAIEIIVKDPKLDNHVGMKQKVFAVLEDERATYLDKA